MPLVIDYNLPMDDVFIHTRRKYNLDASRPHWQQWFFRWVYLTVVRFAFSYCDICAPCEFEACGECSRCKEGQQCRRPRVVMVEQQGVYLDKQVALQQIDDNAKFDSVRPVPLHYELPNASVKYGDHIYPQADNPNRFNQKPPRAMLVLPKDVRQIEFAVEQLVKKSEASVV